MLRNFLWFEFLVNFFHFFCPRSWHEPRTWWLPANKTKPNTHTPRDWGGNSPLLPVDKALGVGPTLSKTLDMPKITSCSWAAGQTICHLRWAHGVCWAYAHLHQHPQELASPRSCQSLFDCLRATMESTGRHGQDSLVESIHFPWFFHFQHQQDPAIHAWLPQAPQCAPRALQPHWPPHWRSRVCARSRARYRRPKMSMIFFLNQRNTLPSMSSLVSYLLTLRLHLNDCDFDSRPLFLISLFLFLYIHIHVYILLLLLYTIFPGTDKTGTGLSSS